MVSALTVIRQAEIRTDKLLQTTVNPESDDFRIHHLAAADETRAMPWCLRHTFSIKN